MFLCMANFCLTLQEGKLKKPLSHMESWKLARARSKRKDDESEYYGNTEKNLESYSESFTQLHPGSDVADPILCDTDETAVVAIRPKYHGRYPCLDGVITPAVSYTRLRASNPSPSGSTGRSHPSLASQHAVSISLLIFFLSHFLTLFSALPTYKQPKFCRHIRPLSSLSISRCGSTCG